MCQTFEQPIYFNYIEIEFRYYSLHFAVEETDYYGICDLLKGHKAIKWQS